MSRKRRILLLLAIVTLAEGLVFSVTAAQNQSDAEYRIKSQDVLYIKVVDSTYDDTVEVDERGMIHLVFTDGDIQAAGKTVDELKEGVVIQLKKLFKNPTVQIRILKRRT